MPKKKISKTYNFDKNVIDLIKHKAKQLEVSESAIARAIMKRGIEMENERK